MTHPDMFEAPLRVHDYNCDLIVLWQNYAANTRLGLHARRTCAIFGRCFSLYRPGPASCDPHGPLSALGARRGRRLSRWGAGKAAFNLKVPQKIIKTPGGPRREVMA